MEIRNYIYIRYSHLHNKQYLQFNIPFDYLQLPQVY